ncbi:hypothetical protein [Arthrobacter sp. B2a2-09]|uniref:hypothetical protein n=1 Tax=Arthrobacter sp. B2a2-09 TaxID=2952822 RepID=UPI0022CD75C3|nr:hypothetical protein [Arthrobacter sp. B2a2-09]MCZ9880209.1 hypothetical protein [Arthrobacter sp. B2a2-09]
MFSVLFVLAVGTPLFPSCGSPGVCRAVGYGSSVTLHITPERAATLATLGIEMCQDGTCHSFSINALTPLTPGPIPLPTSPGAPQAVPLRMADGSIDIRIEAGINDDPLDLTTSGTNTSGWSIGMSHARLKPTTTYPEGRDCGGPTTAVATLDGLGLRAG